MTLVAIRIQHDDCCHRSLSGPIVRLTALHGAVTAGAAHTAMESCRDMVSSPTSRVDFAMAEALAFGTLALFRSAGPKPGPPAHDSSLLSQRPGAELDAQPPAARAAHAGDSPEAARAGLNYGAYAVRLSGQDSERGTFNQRHAVLHDQINGARWVLERWASC